MTKKPIKYQIIETEKGTEIAVVVRGRLLKAQVVKLPFV